MKFYLVLFIIIFNFIGAAFAQSSKGVNGLPVFQNDKNLPVYEDFRNGGYKKDLEKFQQSVFLLRQQMDKMEFMLRQKSVQDAAALKKLEEKIEKLIDKPFVNSGVSSSKNGGNSYKSDPDIKSRFYRVLEKLEYIPICTNYYMFTSQCVVNEFTPLSN
ncbi:hypothetical protein N9W34_02965 [Rickettsiales bacterium]|nr:hypothetical protein [Rickettsiales bacterium]